MNRRSRRLLVWSIKFLPVLALIIFSVFHFLGEYNRLVKRANIIIASELERQLGREVRVKGAIIGRPGLAILRDVEVAEKDRLANGRMIIAREIRVYYDLDAIIRHNKGAGGVSRVVVIDPRLLLLRGPNGKFNVQDLFRRPPGPRRPPFAGTIEIRNGYVTFKDFQAKLSKRPAVNHFSGINAIVSAKDYPEYSFVADLNNAEKRFSAAQVTGTYDTKAKSLSVDIDALNTSAPYLVRYLGFWKSARVDAGNLRVRLGMKFERVNNRTRLSYVGSVRVNNGVVKLPLMKAAVRGVQGRVALLGDRAAVNLTGNVANSFVRVAGTVSEFRSPKMRLVISSPSLDYAAAIKTVSLPAGAGQVRVSGRGAFRARAFGPVSSPIVEVIARVPSATMKGQNARDIFIDGIYRAGVFNVRLAQFGLYGGQFTANGSVRTKGAPSVSLQVRARGVPVSRLPLPKGMVASGTANANFSVEGNLASPRVIGSATIRRGSIGDVAFASANGRFDYSGGVINLQGLAIRNVAGGEVRVDGRASARSLNLVVSADGISLERLGEMIGQPGYRGTAFFTGRITGNPSTPVVDGRIEAFQTIINGYSVDYARADISGNTSKISVKNAVVRLYPAEMAFSGTLRRLVSGNIAFDGTAKVDRLSVEKLSQMIGKPQSDITGTLVGSITASGTFLTKPTPSGKRFANTVASGNIFLEDGAAFGYPIETGEARLSFAGNRLTIDEAIITSEGARAEISGSAAIGGALDLRYSVTGFNLSRIRDRVATNLNVTGIVDANGTIHGSISDPSVTLNAHLNNAIINNREFDDVQMQAVYSDRFVQSFEAKIARGTQVYQITGTDYNIDTNCVASASGRLNDISIPELWSLVHATIPSEEQRARRIIEGFPQITSGRFNAAFDIRGCLARPSGTLTLQAANVNVDSFNIETVNVDVLAEDGVITLQNLSMVSGDMNISASGSPAYKDGRVSLEVIAQNLDLNRLRPWLGDNVPGGVLAADFQITGDVRSPQIIGSVEVVNPSYRGVAFDHLRASSIQIVNNRIELSDVMLAVGSHQAVAQGFVPWDWSTMSIPADQPIQFTAQLHKQDLDLLGTFVSQIDVARTSGEIEGQFNITGTLADPQLGGSLTASNGTVALKNFTNTFTGINADFTFNDDRIVINRLSTASSGGGSLQVEPGGYVKVGTLDTSEISMRIASNGFKFEETNLLGYKEHVNMQIDAGLMVTGTLGAPLIANATIAGAPSGVAISNSNISFAIPEKIAARPRSKFAINPKFDMTIAFGRDVVIAPPSMSLMVSGGGTLTGSLNDPALTLALNVDRGNIRLATSRLQVEPGGKIWVDFTPPAEPAVRVDFQANTSMSIKNRLGDTERYKITLAARGPVTDLHLELTSDPPDLSREQILAALGHVSGIFTSGETALQDELGNILAAVGTSTLLAPIESIFINQLGFEQFTIQYNLSEPITLYVSRRLYDNFYINYYQHLTTKVTSDRDVIYQLQLEYRFRKQFGIAIGIDDQEDGSVTLKYTTRF